MRLKLAQQEIYELKSTLNTIEHKAKEYTENRDVYDKGIREMSDLKQSLAEYKSKCAQQQAELQQLKAKYDEMHEIWYETEKVISQRISKTERNLNMKEEEVARLKQILYGKEDVIRKISIAYEQTK